METKNIKGQITLNISDWNAILDEWTASKTLLADKENKIKELNKLLSHCKSKNCQELQYHFDENTVSKICQYLIKLVKFVKSVYKKLKEWEIFQKKK